MIATCTQKKRMFIEQGHQFHVEKDMELVSLFDESSFLLSTGSNHFIDKVENWSLSEPTSNSGPEVAPVEWGWIDSFSDSNATNGIEDHVNNTC